MLPGRCGDDPLDRAADALLDLAVLLLASWTLVYHLSLLTDLPAGWALAVEIALLAGLLVSWRAAVRRGGGRGDDARPARVGAAATWLTPRRDRLLVWTAAATAVAAALLMAVDARGLAWVVLVACWLVAAGAGATRAAGRIGLRDERPPPADWLAARTGGRVTAPRLAWAWAVLLAGLSTLVRKPNPDDAYYLSMSQWVVDHGTFPLRDTLYSDLRFPMIGWPPMASYDALVGVVARAGGAHAATVEYVLVPPIATLLAVLALWRLLRWWRVPAVPVALSLGLLFLLLAGSGDSYATAGNLFVTRLWQGKVILACLLVPLLLVQGLRYAERPDRRAAAWMAAGGVAAVGLSTSAMFVVPLVALGVVSPLAAAGRWRAAGAGFAAMAAYPLACGVVTKAVGGHSPDDFGARELYRFDPAWFGHQVYLTGVPAVVGVGAVLAGALLLRRPAAALTTGVLVLVVGVTLVPGVTRLGYDLLGLGPTLWRVTWVATVAALVGVAAGSLAAWRGPRLLAVGAPLAVLALLAALGTPVTSSRAGTAWQAPPHWQRSPESLAAARLVVAEREPGDVVLADTDLSITLSVLTTRVKAVTTRDYFMDYLRDEPGFGFHQRLRLYRFANLDRSKGQTYDPDAVARALRGVGVDQVCLRRPAQPRLAFLLERGYRRVEGTRAYGCVAR